MNPCTIRWVERLGFVDHPPMAFVAFALISGLLPSPSPAPCRLPGEPSRTTPPLRHRLDRSSQPIGVRR